MTYDGLIQRCPDAVKLLHSVMSLSPESIPSIFGSKSELTIPSDFASDTSVTETCLIEIKSFSLPRWMNQLHWDIERFGAAINELESSGFVKLHRNQNASIESIVVHAIIRIFICSKAPEGIFTRV
jgi:hypothetical protein